MHGPVSVVLDSAPRLFTTCAHPCPPAGIATLAVYPQLAFAASTMVFGLAGVVSHRRIADAELEMRASEWGNTCLLFLATNAARGIAITLLYPLLRRLGYGLSWREAVVLAYGSMRGAIGMALALIVEEDARVPDDVRAMLAFHVAGTRVGGRMCVWGAWSPQRRAMLSVAGLTQHDACSTPRACAIAQAQWSCPY